MKWLLAASFAILIQGCTNTSPTPPQVTPPRGPGWGKLTINVKFTYSGSDFGYIGGTKAHITDPAGKEVPGSPFCLSRGTSSATTGDLSPGEYLVELTATHDSDCTGTVTSVSKFRQKMDGDSTLTFNGTTGAKLTRIFLQPESLATLTAGSKIVFNPVLLDGDLISWQPTEWRFLKWKVVPSSAGTIDPDTGSFTATQSVANPLKVTLTAWSADDHIAGKKSFTILPATRLK